MYPNDGTVVKHREEKVLLSFEFSRQLRADETITTVLSFAVLDARGAVKTTEFRDGEPVEVIDDYTDEDTGTVYPDAAVHVWARKALLAAEQVRGSYRPQLEVQTSLGQKLIAMIADPADSTSLVLPFLLVTDGLTKLPPGVR